jgi:hypothetical protein
MIEGYVGRTQTYLPKGTYSKAMGIGLILESLKDFRMGWDIVEFMF